MNTQEAVKHTPGPWEACHDADGDYVIFAGDGVIHKIIAITDLDRADDAANAGLIAAAPDMYKVICGLECPDCGHTLEHHADRYNCDVERGDGYRIGSWILEALGPCGCECLECPDLLPLIAVIRKVRGGL